ncbi:MAG: M23 family metallopeptidase [Gemmatimonadota bacterium]
MRPRIAARASGPAPDAGGRRLERPGPRQGARVRVLIVTSLAGVLALGCEAATDLVTLPRIDSPREAYRESLRQARLDETALGRDWVVAGDRALTDPIPIELPLRETAFFPADSAVALGYRLRGLRGRRITATIELQGLARTRVYADLYRAARDSLTAPRLVATLDSTALTFSWEPRRDRDFVFRLQPELLRSGTITVELRSEPALAFPVEGGSWGAVRSVYGDPRDGGRRSHHGVDIFASRGTPALAAATGRVTRVRNTPRGGKTVWLRDEQRELAIYYAHLDSQVVSTGQWVEPGDTLGFVGNTGNARTTPPHLHFGVYRRGEGPTDPDQWLRAWEPRVAEVTADAGALGVRMRLAGEAVPLRLSTGAGGAPRGIPENAVLRVLAASGGAYRVSLPDGETGYVRPRDLEPAVD